MKPIRRVLCATDLSAMSRKALETATVLATSTKATLTILHVSPPPVFGPDEILDARTMDRLQKRNRAWGIRELQKLSKRTSHAGVTTSLLLRDGEPADQIIRAARTDKVDLIVMGTHGRKGLARLFLGSVAQRVVSLAPCPVVTVRAR
jgi:universal stress protein A